MFLLYRIGLHKFACVHAQDEDSYDEEAIGEQEMRAKTWLGALVKSCYELVCLLAMQ